VSATPHATIACAFCGRKDVVTGPDALAAMSDHILACPEHPLARVAGDNALLLKCLVEVFRWLRTPPGQRPSQEMLERTIVAVITEAMGG
jgi:hypothetical protein